VAKEAANRLTGDPAELVLVHPRRQRVCALLQREETMKEDFAAFKGNCSIRDGEFTNDSSRPDRSWGKNYSATSVWVASFLPPQAGEFLRPFHRNRLQMTVAIRAKHMGRSVSTRKVVTYRSGHFTGYVPSGKNSRMIKYESILERDYIQLVECDRDVLEYSEQPEKLNWSDGVDSHDTTFDFEVFRRGGQKYLVEVKPLSKVIKYGLADLYGYARVAAIKKGYDDLELWTDRELKAMPRLGNAELLVGGNTTFEDLTTTLAIRSAISDLRSVVDRATIRDIRAASRLGASAYWGVIRMIALGQLIPECALSPLDDNAVLLFAGGRL
jgi:hypothetical protein